MRILLIEDDIALCEAMAFHLQKEGYTLDSCHDGADALHFIKQSAYDLVILDRMLPSIDGLTILRTLRSLGTTTPVIMVTALNSIGDRVTGLDAGADDYLVKPFAIEELLARVRALSRRPTDWDNPTQLQVNDISLDINSLQLIGPVSTTNLSKKETELFEVFFKHPTQTLPRSLLLSRVWGPDAPVEDGNLDNYIHFLRRRLKTTGSKVQIKTIRAVGYCLEVPTC
ncbi:MAG: response regulator transcription factor [Cellulosilyticaceae bacterium]